MTEQITTSWYFNALKKYGWAPGVVFTFHIIVSKAFDAYNIWPDLDIPMHFLGGFVMAYFYNGLYQEAERHKLLGQPVAILRFITVFALTSTTTILWEFAEFTSDQLFKTHQQVSLADTMGDMLLGMIGGVVLLFLLRRKKS